MRVLLLHNPSAGIGELTAPEIVKILEAAGHRVDYESTDDEGWVAALASPVDCVVAAGGDGTVRCAAAGLAACGAPAALSIIPLGTANNIARALGIEGTPKQIASGLRKPAKTRLAIGRISSRSGDRFFVESIGIGLFPALFEAAHRRKKKKKEMTRAERLADGIKLLRRELKIAEAPRIRIRADGKDLTGKYFMVQVMNIRCIGPQLDLAPAADFTDHRFDLLLAGEEERATVAKFLKRHKNGDRPVLDLPTRPVRRLRIELPRGAVQLDDRLWPEGSSLRDTGSVTITFESFLPVLLPRG